MQLVYLSLAVRLVSVFDPLLIVWGGLKVRIIVDLGRWTGLEVDRLVCRD